MNLVQYGWHEARPLLLDRTPIGQSPVADHPLKSATIGEAAQANSSSKLTTSRPAAGLAERVGLVVEAVAKAVRVETAVTQQPQQHAGLRSGALAVAAALLPLLLAGHCVRRLREA